MFQGACIFCLLCATPYLLRPLPSAATVSQSSPSSTDSQPHPPTPPGESCFKSPPLHMCSYSLTCTLYVYVVNDTGTYMYMYHGACALIRDTLLSVSYWLLFPPQLQFSHRVLPRVLPPLLIHNQTHHPLPVSPIACVFHNTCALLSFTYMNHDVL